MRPVTLHPGFPGVSEYPVGKSVSARGFPEFHSTLQENCVAARGFPGFHPALQENCVARSRDLSGVTGVFRGFPPLPRRENMIRKILFTGNGVPQTPANPANPGPTSPLEVSPPDHRFIWRLSYAQSRHAPRNPRPFGPLDDRGGPRLHGPDLGKYRSRLYRPRRVPDRGPRSAADRGTRRGPSRDPQDLRRWGTVTCTYRMDDGRCWWGYSNWFGLRCLLSLCRKWRTEKLRRCGQ